MLGSLFGANGGGILLQLILGRVPVKRRKPNRIAVKRNPRMINVDRITVHWHTIKNI